MGTGCTPHRERKKPHGEARVKHRIACTSVEEAARLVYSRRV